MIEILPAPAHVAAFGFTGELTGEDYDLCIAEIENRLSRYRRIGILSDLTGFTGLTVQALGKDLRYALSKIGEYRRFARAAIVTDKAWLARTTPFAAHFLPHTDTRTFDPGQREAALAWAADIDPDAEQ